MDKLEYARKLKELAKPFIELGIYDSPEKFLKDIIKNITRERIKTYEKIIRKYERKHGSFEEFTKKLEGRNNPKLEDEWMDWEAAINMLNAWKKAAKELGTGAS